MSDLLFPDDYVPPPSNKAWTPLFPDDYVCPPALVTEPLFALNSTPADTWIASAMQGIATMHQDESERRAVANRLF